MQSAAKHLRGYTLILTECKDYSEVAAARNFILSQGGNVAIIGSKNVMLGWVDPSIASQLVGHYGITAIHYRPIDLSTFATSDRQTFEAVAFFNSVTSGALEKQLLEEKGKPAPKLDYYDGLPHPAISYDDYLKNLEQKGLNVQDLKRQNKLLKMKSDGSLLMGNSDVMVGTVAVAVFFVESNGASDPNLYTWSSADEDSLYQRTLSNLSWWSSMATKYGKALSFNIIPYYHTNSISQQPYEPILHYSYEDSLWIGSIMNNLGFQAGNYFSRVEAYNTYLRSTYHTDWAYSVFFAYNPPPAPFSFKNGYGGYAYMGGPYTQILFTWFSSYSPTVAHETGHIFWAPDEYYVPGYGGCGAGATDTKSGFPNGNCEAANVNSVDCMMKYEAYALCAFTPAHIGWSTEVPLYSVETSPPGLLISVNGVQRVSPQEFPWGLGTKVEISVVSPQTLNGKRYDFLSWSDGGAQTHSITVPNITASYVADFSLAGEAPQTWLLYQQRNALPSPVVNAVAIDGQGNVWIGSEGGLSKFDGENWITYTTANGGIPSDRVKSVAIDAQGNKWIGTEPYWNGSTYVGGAVAKFDGTNWTVYNTSNSGLPTNYVWSIAIDASGNKWIGTYGGGLAKFDGTKWTVYNTSNSGLPSNYVWSIAIDASGNKWIGTYGGGLAKFDGAKWTVYNASNSGLPGNGVYSVAIDASGNKWIGTWGGLACLRQDGVSWTVYNTSNSGLPNGNVYSIAIDPSGNKWIGTLGGGLACLRQDGVNWTVYNTSNSGLHSNYVSSIAVDASGNKWIGTGGYLQPTLVFLGAGLACLRQDGVNWTVYSTSNAWLNYVYSIAIDASGNKWIGTERGLACLRQDGVSWAVYNTSNSGLPGNYVWSIAIDASGNKWIGTERGLACLRQDGVSWTVYNTSNSGLPGNYVYSIAIDASGNKWIGTAGEWNGSSIVGGGLAKFDGTNWTVYNTSNSGLPENAVSSIAIDALDNKWIGTWNGGLAKFDGTNWTVYKWSNSGLPSDRVYSIAIDASGNKWVGAWGGLAKFDGTNWTLYNTSNSPLPGEYVYWIAIDASGNKWIGDGGDWNGSTYVRGGLACLRQDGVNWTIYNTSNSGLPANYVRSIAIDASGNKWIATYGGGLAEFNENGIPIGELNHAPRVTSWPVTVAKEDSLYSYQLVAYDPDGDTLRYSLVSSPTWLSINNSTGLIQGTPHRANIGDTSVVAQVTDGKGGSAIQSYTLRVLHTNHPPSALRLILPANGDTVRITFPAKPLKFVWARAMDTDPGDILQYKLRLNGTGFDTTVAGLRDTTVELNIMSRLRLQSAYTWTASVSDGLVSVASVDTFTFRTSSTVTATGGLASDLPKEYALRQNYPNPFNPSTTISFDIPRQSHVKLVIYDVLGRQVRTLVDEEKVPGRYTVNFDASNLPSGVYLCRIAAGDFTQVRKMLVVK